MDRLFAALRDSQRLKIEGAESTATFLAELNAIHPFREGNGRSQLAFIDLLGEKAGFPFDFSRVERETFLPAMIASYDGNLKPMVDELKKLLA
jgi:cell filamentation protein